MWEVLVGLSRVKSEKRLLNTALENYRRRAGSRGDFLAAAKETNVDAALLALISELDGILRLEEGHKNYSEGFSRSTTRFCSSPD